jgi:ATP-dependent DNA ligase
MENSCMSVYEILQELEATSSKNEKEAILLKHKDDETLKRCFELTYSPTIQFYIKQLPEVSVFEEALGTLEGALDLLPNLYNRIYTGHDARGYLAQLLYTTNQKDQEVVKRIVLKDLRCGVGETTINKIWKGLIPTIPQMLASSMKEKSLAKIKFPAVAELKSDGSRCIAYCNTKGVVLMSRNGKQYQNLCDLETSLSDELFDGFVLDGELVFDTTKADRTTGNGIITKAVKGTISEEEQSNVVFQVWDIIPQDNYKSKAIYKVSQTDRYNHLKDVLGSVDKHNIQLIPSQVVNTMEEAKEVFRNYVDQGYEGIILKNRGGFWADKRTSDLVKFKEELFADLKVVDYYEGEGKAQGMLGGLSLESEDGVIKVNVGSGFTDEQRKQIWQDRNLDIVEIKYNGITEDKKTGQKSLFLPIFIRERLDKSVANTWDEMQ